MRNINKAGILTVAAISAVSALSIGVSAAGANHGGPHCDALPTNITPDHPDWHDSLDRDGDGVACEAPGGGSGGGSGGDVSEPQSEAEPAPEAPPAEPRTAEPTFTG